MRKLFRIRTMIQLAIFISFIFIAIAPSPVWAKIDPGQWHATWEETNSALEGAVDNPKLLKKIKKAANSSGIGKKLQKLDSLNGEYETAQGQYFRSNTPKDLKKWKQVLSKFSKEMKRLAKSKDKYIGNMKALLNKANAGEKVEKQFRFQKKNLKAIESGVRYTYGKHTSFLEQNATMARSSDEMLSREAAIKIKTMKAGLRNGVADLGKGIAKVQSKPKLKTYKKYLLEDIRTVRGLLGDCKKIAEIPDPPKGLRKAFADLEKEIRSGKLDKEAANLVKKFRQSQEKAEEMVVLGQIDELEKARKSLKGYVKQF